MQDPPNHARRTRRRQVHLWLSEREYQWLTGLAQVQEETLSAALRKMVREAQRQSSAIDNSEGRQRSSRWQDRGVNRGEA